MRKKIRNILCHINYKIIYFEKYHNDYKTGDKLPVQLTEAVLQYLSSPYSTVLQHLILSLHLRAQHGFSAVGILGRGTVLDVCFK